MRFVVAALAFFELVLEAAALFFRVVELAEAVGDFHLPGKNFKALHPIGFVRLVFRERRNRGRELVDHGWLHEVFLGDRFK